MFRSLSAFASVLGHPRSGRATAAQGGSARDGPRWPTVRRRLERNAPLRIVGFYLVISIIWLLASDWFVAAFLPAADQLPAQNLKGVAFVTLTSLVLLILLLRERTAVTKTESALENLTDRLDAILVNAPLAVITLDLDGMVCTWNPAAERTFGWSAGLVIGRPNPIVPPDEVGHFGMALGATLAGDSVAEARVTGMRADGSRLELRRWTAPLRNRDGVVIGAVAMLEDITRELTTAAEKDRLVAAMDHEVVRQVQLAAALERMSPRSTPAATAEAICSEVVGMEDVETAGILSFGPTGVVPLATVGPAEKFIVPGRRLPRARAEHLHELATRGAWTEEWVGGIGDSVEGVAGFRAAGMRAGAYVPIRGDNGPLGVLGVGSSGDDALERLNRILPALNQVSAIASALLLPALRTLGQHETVAERIQTIITNLAFRPVFQPILELATGRVVASEALTRFDDGTPPDVRFAEAELVGLGQALEICCLTELVKASAALPEGVRLGLNVSPGLVIAGKELSRVLRATDRQIAIEITEHVAISDYPELRSAVDRLVPKVRLSVDDAGAGFASLRHILELRPNSVKLDQALVRSIQSDPARQALVAGMSHFARTTGAMLIAEGIETEEERRTLQMLGVEYGQGFLLGRPESLGAAVVGGALKP